MKTIEYKFRDKTTWGDGPWMNEPDKIQWLDEETNMPCLIVRNPSGALCGYVGVTSEHPAYGKDYSEVNVDVHGGLTFAHTCLHTDDNLSICHVVEDGEDDNVWWFGFDTAHTGDLVPRYNNDEKLKFMNEDFMGRPATYKNIAYVRRETLDLAKQLVRYAPDDDTASTDSEGSAGHQSPVG